MLGVSQSLVQRRIAEWGWARNEELPPLKVALPVPPPVPKFRFIDDGVGDEEPLTAMLPVPAGDLTGRLRRLVEREIARLEARPGSPDVTRALGSLARIIAQLNEMGANEPVQPEPEFERPNMDEFRRNLAAKLMALVARKKEEDYEKLANNPPFSVGPWGG